MTGTEAAIEAASYGRQARRDGFSIDSYREHGDGYLNERWFQWGWSGEDKFIADGGIDGLRARLEAGSRRRAARKRLEEQGAAVGMMDAMFGKAAE